MAQRSTRERAEREARRRARLYSARQQLFAKRVARRRRDNRIAGIVFAVVVVLATLAQIAYFTAGPGRPAPTSSPKPTVTATPTPTPSGTAPPPSAAENRSWTGSMTLNTSKIALTLDGKKAPHAVANFVTLVKKGFYTGLTCHRLTTGSLKVLQCGDPTGNGSGGPGYSFGPIENAPKSNVYPSGTLAMARTQDDASSQGSQFFIVYGTSAIPADSAGGYTVFGRVTAGLSGVRAAITSKGVAAGGASASDGAPKVATRITAVSVR